LNSTLLYLLAEARAKHGDMPAAEATAQQALKVSPGPDNGSLSQHWYTAWRLQDRGLVEWAARELRYIISASPVPSDMGIKASISLADLLHEDENDEAAAQTLKQLDSTPSNGFDSVVVMGDTGGDPLTLGNIRARINFYSACNARAKGDHMAERKFLQNALAGNAYDIEVLIAAFQLSDSPADFKRDVRQRIEKMAAKLRERIADNANHPASARWCNEFAWLISNTEGDFDEALGYSKSSIEYMPVGGYYDTLARAYIAKGNFAEALKAQTKAVTLLPHNKAIKRQYEMLKKKEAGVRRQEHELSTTKQS
jgi:tetratricopeptide (TPR) repeat protein